jgi:hypothetical protein
VAETASFLCRGEVEVRAKMKALGLVEPGQAARFASSNRACGANVTPTERWWRDVAGMANAGLL